jgi:hypothetical protein
MGKPVVPERIFLPEYRGDQERVGDLNCGRKPLLKILQATKPLSSIPKGSGT